MSKIYIPYPDEEARIYLISRLIEKDKKALNEKKVVFNENDIKELAEKTDNYSAADIEQLLKAAA